MDEEYLENENRQISLKDFKTLKFLLRFMKKYKGMFIFILLLDILVNAAFTMEPLITKNLIAYLTEAIGSNEEIMVLMQRVFFFVFLDLAVWVFAGIGGYFVTISLKKIGQKIIADMRDEMFSHVMSLSLKQLRSIKIGSYVTRITNDTQNLSTLFSDILPQLLRGIQTLLIISVTTLIATGLYGFIFLAYMPIVFFISYLFQKKAKKYYRQEKDSISIMNSFLSESFQGIKVIKAFNSIDKKNEEFSKKNENIRSSFLKSQYLFAIFYPFMYLLQISCVLIILIVGLPNVISGVLTIDNFYLLYSYSQQFFQPIQTITQLLNQFQSIITSADRTSYVLQLEPEKEKENLIDDVTFKGKIEFKHVYFAYVEDKYVLKDVSFVINPGETAAFVGPTGAGKSTIISLITRTYEINSGEILIDDRDINEYSLTCLRRNIGVMLQDVFIFSGTIKDNISLLSEEVKDEEIKKACEYVEASSFIEKLDKKYDSEVVEKGENFSAGQRQLLSFARTLVYKPSLMLLDEATANIDTETENIIQTSLEKMMNISTMLIVAHRLSTIKKADKIFVVQKGKIIESGNHQSLLKLKGTYYNLYKLQNMEKNLGKGEENE